MNQIFAVAAALLIFCSCSRSQVTMSSVPESAVKAVREAALRDVAAGYLSEEEIVDGIVDLLADEHDGKVIRPIALQAVRLAVVEHRNAEATWPAVTDCDRLDKAFAELEKSGVVCRQNFSCCGTCGAGEIFDEIEEARKEGRSVRGYAFFHMQDTESAAEGSGLHLSYGAIVDGEGAALTIARSVVEALERNGLNTQWNGTWGERIFVQMDWKKRRKA